MKAKNNIIKKFFRWIFSDELKSIEQSVNSSKFELEKIREKSDKLSNILGNIDVSVDVHEYSRSWAVISIQGEKSDYIKFVDLGRSEIREIENFLRHFDRRKIDASPQASRYLKFN